MAMEALGFAIHFEQGHKNGKYTELLLKLFIKCCQKYLYKLNLIVGKGRI